MTTFANAGERRAWMVRAYRDEKMSIGRIAKICGLGPGWVRQVLNREGVCVPTPRATDSVDHASLISDYINGATLLECGQIHNISSDAVRQILRDYEIPRRGHGPNGQKRILLTQHWSEESSVARRRE